MERQNNPVTADFRYYPFTENNPFAPWYSKWNIALLGESAADHLTRMNLKDKATNIYDQIKVNPNFPTGTQTPNIGIGINNPFTPVHHLVKCGNQ